MSRVRRPTARAGWIGDVAGALTAAAAAAAVLRPASGLIAPLPVRAQEHFSAEELARARRFARPQRALYAASLAIEAGALAALLRRPVRRLPNRRRGIVRADAVHGASLSLIVTAASLPLAAIARQRAVRAGLLTQSWRGWAADTAKAGGLGAGLAAAATATAKALMRRFGSGWWVPGAAVVSAAGTGLVFVGPVLLDPLFGRFTALPDGSAREDVLELARRAGVRIGQVYSVDASRRSTAANAYVTGLGATKRVVLFDTLIENFSAAELRLVVAHELSHVRHRDVPRSLGFLALTTPLALRAGDRLAARLAALEPSAQRRASWRTWRARRPDATRAPDVLPALALALGLVAAGVGVAANALSRAVENRADVFALALTGEVEPFVAFERRLALRNLSDPDPPRWLTALLATHPSTVARIGIALAYSADSSSAGGPPPNSGRFLIPSRVSHLE